HRRADRLVAVALAQVRELVDHANRDVRRLALLQRRAFLMPLARPPALRHRPTCALALPAVCTFAVVPRLVAAREQFALYMPLHFAAYMPLQFAPYMPLPGPPHVSNLPGSTPKST